MNGGRPVQLAPRVFNTLRMLVENSGRVLSKEKMLAEVWEDSFVEENNLAQNISLLRKILAESETDKFIETVPKFGYRFVAPVEQRPSRTRNFDDGKGFGPHNHPRDKRSRRRLVHHLRKIRVNRWALVNTSPRRITSRTATSTSLIR